MRLMVVSALLCGALTAVLVWVWLRDWELAFLVAAPIGIAFGTVIGAFAATSEKAPPPAPRGQARSPRSRHWRFRR
jgi:MFS family permease